MKRPKKDQGTPVYLDDVLSEIFILARLNYVEKAVNLIHPISFFIFHWKVTTSAYVRVLESKKIIQILENGMMLFNVSSTAGTLTQLLSPLFKYQYENGGIEMPVPVVRKMMYDLFRNYEAHVGKIVDDSGIFSCPLLKSIAKINQQPRSAIHQAAFHLVRCYLVSKAISLPESEEQFVALRELVSTKRFLTWFTPESAFISSLVRELGRKDLELAKEFITMGKIKAPTVDQLNELLVLGYDGTSDQRFPVEIMEIVVDELEQH